jgi:hypothetical protein
MLYSNIPKNLTEILDILHEDLYEFLRESQP